MSPALQLPDGSTVRDYEITFDVAETFESALYRSFRPLQSGSVLWTHQGVTYTCHYASIPKHDPNASALVPVWDGDVETVKAVIFT